MRPAWLALGLLFAAPAHAGERWPLWPSEVTRAAEPLRVGEARQLLVVPEAHKLQALRALERYPTALVAPILLESLTDGTASIRREALQACLERVLLECIPGALRQWHSETPDTGARIAALRVLALDAPTAPGRPELLISALRDPDESVRAEAAHTLARVTWPDDLLLRVRTALIGKLADTAPPVRRAAARSLGLSQAQTMRHVVLPQAIRRVVPPLLNDLVALLKDIGLVSILGARDAIRNAQIETSTTFNYTPYIVASILFLLVTIPLTRLTDRVLERSIARQNANGTA